MHGLMAPHNGRLSLRVWVVIAAYNEAAVIGRVINDVKRRGYSVVVVDDGSTDRTAEASAAADVLVRHPINLGQGAALQTGIDFGLERGADIVVTFDADGQHLATDIEKLVEATKIADVDFALGSRFLGCTEGMPVARRVLLK